MAGGLGRKETPKAGPHVTFLTFNFAYFYIELNIHHYCKNYTTEIKTISGNIVTYLNCIFNLWWMEGGLSVICDYIGIHILEPNKLFQMYVNSEKYYKQTRDKIS